jgi:hypothetical protein
VAGQRGDRVEEAGPEADAGAGQADAEGRDQAGRRRRAAHGGQAEGDFSGVDGEDGVHEEVVQAVHRVDAVQQVPDLRHRAPPDQERDALVAPHPAAVEPPQPQREHHGHRHDHGDDPRTRPSPVPVLTLTLAVHLADFVLLASSYRRLTVY